MFPGSLNNNDQFIFWLTRLIQTQLSLLILLNHNHNFAIIDNLSSPMEPAPLIKGGGAGGAKKILEKFRRGDLEKSN